MLDKVRLALRISTPVFDDEIKDLIKSALADLALSGIVGLDEADPNVIMAVKTYCRMHFGQPDDYDRLKAAYDEQKAQLQMASGYGLEVG